MKDERPHGTLPGHRVDQMASGPPVLHPGRQAVCLVVTATEGPAANGGPLVGQRLDGQAPAGTQIADPVGVGHPDVGHEHLGEVPVAVDLFERSDFHARRRHVDSEHGESPMLGLRDVGARQTHPPPGIGPPRRPDLGAVQDPLVAVALGTHAGIGQVRTGVGLGEHLTPDL